MITRSRPDLSCQSGRHRRQVGVFPGIMQMHMHTLSFLAAALLSGSGIAFAHDAATAVDPLANEKAPQDAKVFIVSPKNGATVGQDVTVKFGARGIAIEPAGVPRPNSGHHHLLIDTREYAAPRHTHSQRCQTQALRQGPDSGHDPPAARHAYAATNSWQWPSHAVRSAAGVEEDHDSCEIALDLRPH